MGEGGVGEGNAVWSNGFTIRTLKSLNIWLGGVLLTFPCERRSLFFPDTGTLGLVKHKWRGAVIGVGEPVHTVIVPGGEVLVCDEYLANTYLLQTSGSSWLKNPFAR